MYIKGINNTVADVISLDYGPVTYDKSIWMTFARNWCYHNAVDKNAINPWQTPRNLPFEIEVKRTPLLTHNQKDSRGTITGQQPEQTSQKVSPFHPAGQKHSSTL